MFSDFPIIKKVLDVLEAKLKQSFSQAIELKQLQNDLRKKLESYFNELKRKDEALYDHFCHFFTDQTVELIVNSFSTIGNKTYDLINDNVKNHMPNQPLLKRSFIEAFDDLLYICLNTLCNYKDKTAVLILSYFINYQFPKMEKELENALKKSKEWPSSGRQNIFDEKKVFKQINRDYSFLSSIDIFEPSNSSPEFATIPMVLREDIDDFIQTSLTDLLKQELQSLAKSFNLNDEINSTIEQFNTKSIIKLDKEEFLLFWEVTLSNLKTIHNKKSQVPEHLLQRAKKCTEKLNTCFFLCGSGGTGKTFFLEYLLYKSTTQHDFIVLYVDVNRFGNADEVIQKILSKISRVFETPIENRKDLLAILNQTEKKIIMAIDNLSAAATLQSDFFDFISDFYFCDRLKWIFTISDNDLSTFKFNNKIWNNLYYLNPRHERFYSTPFYMLDQINSEENISESILQMHQPDTPYLGISERKIFQSLRPLEISVFCHTEAQDLQLLYDTAYIHYFEELLRIIFHRMANNSTTLVSSETEHIKHVFNRLCEIFYEQKNNLITEETLNRETNIPDIINQFINYGLLASHLPPIRSSDFLSTQFKHYIQKNVSLWAYGISNYLLILHSDALHITEALTNISVLQTQWAKDCVQFILISSDGYTDIFHLLIDNYLLKKPIDEWVWLAGTKHAPNLSRLLTKNFSSFIKNTNSIFGALYFYAYADIEQTPCDSFIRAFANYYTKIVDEQVEQLYLFNLKIRLAHESENSDLFQLIPKIVRYVSMLNNVETLNETSTIASLLARTIFDGVANTKSDILLICTTVLIELKKQSNTLNNHNSHLKYNASIIGCFLQHCANQICYRLGCSAYHVFSKANWYCKHKSLPKFIRKFLNQVSMLELGKVFWKYSNHNCNEKEAYRKLVLSLANSSDETKKIHAFYLIKHSIPQDHSIEKKEGVEFQNTLRQLWRDTSSIKLKQELCKPFNQQFCMEVLKLKQSSHPFTTHRKAISKTRKIHKNISN